MNEVLARQLRRLGLSADDVPTMAAWQDLLASLSRSYDDADRSRYLLERSLRISSEEMMEMNRALEERSQRRVERSESHYRAVFTRSPIALWEQDYARTAKRLRKMRRAGVIDLDAHLAANTPDLDRLISGIRTIGLSDAAARLVRADNPTDLLGSFDPSVFSAESRASFLPQFRAMWAGSGQVEYEFTGERLDGEQFHGILHWTAPEVGNGHDFSRVIVAMIDITERKRAEEAMSGLVRAKDEFLAAVSHELRTPLTSVYGSAEVLLEQWPDLSTDDRLELVRFVAHESGELTAMVEDLLVAARAKREAIAVRAERIDLRRMVAGVVDAVSRSGLRVPVDVSEVCGIAWADPLRVRQIVRNLVTNALRYGGDVIRVQSAPVGPRIHLTVCDNGDGVGPDRQEAIFDLYESGAGDPGLPGALGIGLSVSRRLARLMGGDLTYDYAGDWSRFRLDLARPVITSRSKVFIAEG